MRVSFAIVLISKNKFVRVGRCSWYLLDCHSFGSEFQSIVLDIVRGVVLHILSRLLYNQTLVSYSFQFFLHLVCYIIRMSLMMDIGDNLHGITFTQVRVLFAIALRSRSIHLQWKCVHTRTHKYRAQKEERQRERERRTKTRKYKRTHDERKIL